VSGRAFRVAAAIAAAAAVALLPVSGALAYRTSKTDSGAELHWPDSSFPLRYSFSSAGSQDVGPDATHSAWAAAQATWQAVDCAYVTYATPGSSSASQATNGDTTTLAIFYENSWFQGADSALAITTPVYTVDTGEISDADTVFNGYLYDWAVNGDANKTDLQSVATHEFGHALGMDHPCEIGGANGAPDCCDYSQGGCTPKPEYYVTTMFPATDPGNTMERTLAEDDIAGICHLYPSGTMHMPTPMTGSTLGAACQSPSDCTSPQFCVDLGNGSAVCSESCSGTCSEPGFMCAPLQGGGGACIADPNAQPFGSSCTASTDCASQQCVANPSGGRFCSQTCGTCPQGYVCGQGVCQVDQGGGSPDGGPGPTTTGAGQGEPCSSSASCLTGLSCVNDGSRQYCTTPCSDASQCPGGFQCTSGVCAFSSPSGGNLGAACTAPTDCLTSQCINDGTSQYCSQGCALQTDCPAGYLCATVGSTGLCAQIPGAGGGTNPLGPGTPPSGGCSSIGAAPAATSSQTLFGLLLLVSLMGIPILARRPR
jgi:hypothetical protein